MGQENGIRVVFVEEALYVVQTALHAITALVIGLSVVPAHAPAGPRRTSRPREPIRAVRPTETPTDYWPPSLLRWP